MDNLTLLIIALLALAAFVAFVVTRPESKGRPVQRLPTGNTADLERRVLTQMRGNRGAVERLVTGKRKQHPRASRRELLEMVYEDYIRHNR